MLNLPCSTLEPNLSLCGWIITSVHLKCSVCTLHGPVHMHKNDIQQRTIQNYIQLCVWGNVKKQWIPRKLSPEHQIVCLLFNSFSRYHWEGMAVAPPCALKQEAHLCWESTGGRGKHAWGRLYFLSVRVSHLGGSSVYRYVNVRICILLYRHSRLDMYVE